MMDIAIEDIAEHRKKYAEQWQKRGDLVRLRKRKLEEESARKAEKIRQRQAEAVASFKTKQLLEQDRVKAQLAQAAEEKMTQEAEERKQQESTMVWHPYVRCFL